MKQKLLRTFAVGLLTMLALNVAAETTTVYFTDFSESSETKSTKSIAGIPFNRCESERRGRPRRLSV